MMHFMQLAIPRKSCLKALSQILIKEGKKRKEKEPEILFGSTHLTIKM